MRKFFGYFLQGLILFIPLIITVFIVWKLFDFFAGLFSFMGFSENALLNTLLGTLLTFGSLHCLVPWLHRSFSSAPLVFSKKDSNTRRSLGTYTPL
jgi:hypothetical protein